MIANSADDSLLVQHLSISITLGLFVINFFLHTMGEIFAKNKEGKRIKETKIKKTHYISVFLNKKYW